jgi:hypothetical protein
MVWTAPTEPLLVWESRGRFRPIAGGRVHDEIARIGLDIAKRWFQLHAVDGDDREVLNRKLPRDTVLAFLAGLPPCNVALERYPNGLNRLGIPKSINF